VEVSQSESERDHVELAAYYLWEQRGCPIGSPQVDWFQAEEQFRRAARDEPPEPAMIGVAKAMGAALGSLAGAVVSVTHLHSGETSPSD
jgi:hypothetical protein